MSSAWPFLLRFHAVFACVAAAALAPAFSASPPSAGRAPYSSGSAVLALVLGWNGAFLLLVLRLPDFAWRHAGSRRQASAHAAALLDSWKFCATVSVFQLLPDMLLVWMGTLEFPRDGAPLLGGVSVYMAGMWTIPLLALLASCPPRRQRGSAEAPTTAELLRAALLSLGLFGGAEHLTHPLRLWRATGAVKHRLGNAAAYVLLPEALGFPRSVPA